MFCGGLGHYVCDCPVAAQYIQHGKIARNNENKLVLPDGRFVPWNLSGNTMRECVDYYLSLQGQRELGRNQDYVATNFLKTLDEFIFEFDVSPTSSLSSTSSMRLSRSCLEMRTSTQLREEDESSSTVSRSPRKSDFLPTGTPQLLQPHSQTSTANEHSRSHCQAEMSRLTSLGSLELLRFLPLHVRKVL